jgi:uncharacterized protein with LGFP repeats
MPICPDSQSADGVGRYQYFEHGSIFWHPSTGVHETHGAIRNIYGKFCERLGYPISDERPVFDDELDELANLALDPNEEQKENLIHLHWGGRAHAKHHSRCSEFERGRIFWLSVRGQGFFEKVIFDDAGKRAGYEPWNDLTQGNWAVADESLGNEKETLTCPKEKKTRRSRSSRFCAG